MKNGVLFQYFEWNLPADSQLWNQLARDASHLARIGISAVWIPPAYKGGGINDVGYGAYDLYDFGEFNQKGTVATKYGTRAELETAIKALHDNGIQVILDTVFNQKMNGDSPERFIAQPVDAGNRMNNIGAPRQIESFTSFEFPGRGDKYSPFKWHWYHFSGVDYDNLTGDSCIFRIVGPGKGWSVGVDQENGNYDFLMGNNVDVNNPEVANELITWGCWALDTFGFDGFRMDAAKHIDYPFTKRFLEMMRQHSSKPLYAVSEYWSENTDLLTGYIDRLEGATDLFDVPLHFNFYRASVAGEKFDMRTILDVALVMSNPQNAVTFVDNHDSQPGSELTSNVQDWFKPLAYALILLMQDGYPIIFYGDYYSENRVGSYHRRIIDILLQARNQYAYGSQTLLLDHPSTIALIRHGDEAHANSGLILLMTNGDNGTKDITLGQEHAGEIWHELTGSIPYSISLDNNGHAPFSVNAGKIAVWVKS